jgi:gliding motility-associated-like protein
LTVNPVVSNTVVRRICQGDTVRVGNRVYQQTGIYRDTFQTRLGCDSILITNLTVSPIFISTQNQTICAGAVFRIGSKTYTQSGIYRDTLKTQAACDSIVITNLRILDSIKTNQSFQLCTGNTIRIGTKTYNQTGIYRDTLRAFTGCDSLVVTNLTVNPLSMRLIDTTICSGNSLRVNGKIYRQSGTFTDTIRRQSPLCDSLITVKLAVQTLSTETRQVTLCNGDTLRLNGRIITKSGTYADTIVPIGGGCNQVVIYEVKTVDLQVKFGDDLSIERGDSIRLTPSVSLASGIVLRWRPEKDVPCRNCLNPTVSPRITTIYELEARDTASNCVSSDEIQLTVNTCSKIFIPNSFSPNGDTQNDYFSIFAAPCVRQVRRLSIYNRWGDLVFSKTDFPPNDEKQGWDGTWQGRLLQTGVYVYVIELDLKDGTTERYGGDISLLR